MATMNLTLPDDLRLFVETQAAQDGCASPDEFLVKLIRTEQRRRATEALDGKLKAALANGPVEPMTRDDWESLETEVWQRHRAG